MNQLAKRKCVPCDGKTPRVEREQANALLSQLAQGWKTTGGKKLERQLTFADFRAAMAFLNRLAEVAEAEQHHPDFAVHYNKVDITLFTHAIDGLSENDFILAAKIDELVV